MKLIIHTFQHNIEISQTSEKIPEFRPKMEELTEGNRKRNIERKICRTVTNQYTTFVSNNKFQLLAYAFIILQYIEILQLLTIEKLYIKQENLNESRKKHEAYFIKLYFKLIRSTYNFKKNKIIHRPFYRQIDTIN